MKVILPSMRTNLFSVMIDISTIVFQQRITPYCNWYLAFIFAKLMAFLSWYTSRIEENPLLILQMKTL